MVALRGNPRGVFSSFMFCSGRLPMPTRDVVTEDTPLFFLRERVPF